jgi:hypothetical protein
MYVADLPTQAWIGFLLFGICVPWLVIGNLVLTRKLARRGREVPFLLQGSTLFLYPLFRPKVEPGGTDRLAAMLAVVLVTLIGTLYFLGDDMWPGALRKP